MLLALALSGLLVSGTTLGVGLVRSTATSSTPSGTPSSASSSSARRRGTDLGGRVFGIQLGRHPRQGNGASDAAALIDERD